MIGASVSGPYRSKDGSLNQDAFLLQSNRKYQLAVVCDGMGSKPYAREGARKATLAVQAAASIWMRHGQQKPERLIRLIHQIWNVMIEPLDGRDAVTTCLIAILDRSGKGLIAQLGDGLIFWKQPNGVNCSLILQDRDFINETTGLGIANSISAWRWQVVQGFSTGHSLLLCTDGISESIEEALVPEFIDWLAQTYHWMPHSLANWRLSRQLINWPNPIHQDDKTLCLLWA